MRTSEDTILKLAKVKGRLLTNHIVAALQVSRQYASLLISGLVQEGKLLKLGSTRKAFYVLPEYASAHPELYPHRLTRTYKNTGLEEHKVLGEIEQTFPLLGTLPENIRSIFTYAFSEMLNNAIEHSRSARIKIEVSATKKEISFTIQDFGIGVFRNVMKQRALKSELEAIQDILKGKTTTMPKSHSGEGIFFTSKSGDQFTLDSFGYQLIVNNDLPDEFVKQVKQVKKGTVVIFKIRTDSNRHLHDVFKKFTNIDDQSDYGFDKTEIRVKLYTMGGVHISRSQARRVLSGLDKFHIVVFDFDKVPTIGQAFADEVFRVFHLKHPDIKLETENMQEGVKFMVERAISEAGKS
jgi:anti-sigma regulatory factor (Ser/Thr protein kinase)